MVRLLLHAPNVHIGGGFILLKELLAATDIGFIWGNLDVRTKDTLSHPAGMKCNFVYPSIFSRLAAEYRLQKIAQPKDLILCFHGMPPMLPLRGHVIVFQQNRLHIDQNDLSSFSGRIRLRIKYERFICNFFKCHVHEYIVQTPSMQSLVNNWHSGKPKIRVVPFMQLKGLQQPPAESKKKYDFIYVADGDAHKNHRNLLRAWIKLSEEGIYPTLGVTLSERFALLQREFDQAVVIYGLRITNLGLQAHEEILQLYNSAHALVFPSVAESFGLPLVEASNADLPIIASELDFVRDVCLPVETFDPDSPVSIARAIKRFLDIKNEPIKICSATDFLMEICRESSSSRC